MTNVVLPRGVIEKLSSFVEPDEFRQHVLKESAEALKGIDLLYNQVLVGIYIRAVKTAGGIIRPMTNVEEDVWQGKVGLVLKKGPTAFVDDESYSFFGQSAEVGDWIGFKIGDTWSLQVGEFPCRAIRDSDVRLKLSDPRSVF